MPSLPAAIVNEWKRLAVRARGSRILNLLLVAFFGVAVPWRYGFDFFDPFVIFAYSAICFLLATVITDLMAPGVSESPVEARVIASAAHSWMILIVIQIAGIATVNALFQAPRFLHPNWALAAACLIFALAGSLLTASVGAFLSKLFSPNAARQTLRIGFIVLLLLVVRGPQMLPPLWQASINQQLTTEGLTRVSWIGGAAAGLISLGLLAALRKSE